MDASNRAVKLAFPQDAPGAYPHWRAYPHGAPRANKFFFSRDNFLLGRLHIFCNSHNDKSLFADGSLFVLKV